MRKSLLFFFICLFSLNAYALGGKKYQHIWWKDPQIVSQLELSDRQVKNIDNIFYSYKQLLIKLKKELNKAEGEFKEKVSSDVSKEEAYTLINNIGELKTGLAQIRFEMWLNIKKVLTPEQRTKLLDIRKSYRQMRH